MIRNEKFTELFNKFSHITFQERTHTYYVAGQKVQSVTSYIKNKYLKPFNAEEAAAYKARKTGLPVSYWVNYWKLLGQEASSRGSRVHFYAAHYNSKVEPKDALEEAVKSFYEEVFSCGWEIVATELIVGSSVLVGTLDLLLHHEMYGYWLVDFKTNDKNLEMSTVDFLDGTKKTLYEQYMMQLSLYEHLLGLGTITKTICHITPVGYHLLPSQS